MRHGARAGCRNCTAGYFDDDLDTTTPCAECPEGKDSDPGATECATSLAAEVEDDVTRASDFIEAAAALVAAIASVAGAICWVRRGCRDEPEEDEQKYDRLDLQPAEDPEDPQDADDGALGRTPSVGDRYYIHAAFQYPPVLVGESLNQAEQRGRLEGIKSLLLDSGSPQHREFREERRFPVCVSDAATLEIEDALRKDAVHGLVWCATGHVGARGWERHTAGAASLESIAQIVQTDKPSQLRVAVVCLKYGARKAAQALHDAGVRTVIWLAANVLGDDCADVLLRVVAPALDSLRNRRGDPALESFIAEKCEELDTIGSGGCLLAGGLDDPPLEWSATPFVRLRTRRVRVTTNFGPGLVRSLRDKVHPDDLTSIKDLQDRFQSGQEGGEPLRIRLLHSHGASKDRVRAVAFETCASFLQASHYDAVLRICSDADVKTVKDALERQRGRTLLWIDLQPDVQLSGTDVAEDDPDTAALTGHTTVSSLLSGRAYDALLTSDPASANALEALTGEEGFEEYSLDDVQEENVETSQLYDEFKLRATLVSGPVEKRVCLLDLFDRQALQTSLEKQLDAPVAALYYTDDADEEACAVRVCVSDARFLHQLRNQILSGDFDVQLTQALKDLPRLESAPRRGGPTEIDESVEIAPANPFQAGGRIDESVEAPQTGRKQQPEPELAPEQEPGHVQLDGALRVAADRTHFAEMFEQNTLALENLTPHQKEKLQECVNTNDDVHIKAPAGAGKTFIALHLVLKRLEDEADDARVLFVSRNSPLGLFFAKWLGKRIANAAKRRRLLARLHLLYTPLDEGPRSVRYDFKSRQLVTEPVPGSEHPYDLVIVDEAHHIYLDPQLRTSVEAVAKVGGSRPTRCCLPGCSPRRSSRLVLLSDISQARRYSEQFPFDLVSIELEEVVRSTGRICAGATAFQLGDDVSAKDRLVTKCHHEQISGPPLKSYIFPRSEEPSDRRAEIYANHTLRALGDMLSQFPGLDFHDRLAIVVPDEDFRIKLKHALAPMLEELGQMLQPSKALELKTAEEASRACSFGSAGRTQGGSDWLIMDEIGQMDGLERLIVICVGLDSPIGEEAVVTLETRSVLYRAITRAQMAVSVVDRLLPKGWFAFLSRVELEDKKKFDVGLVRLDSDAVMIDTEDTSSTESSDEQHKVEMFPSEVSARTSRRVVTSADDLAESYTSAELELSKLKRSEQPPDESGLAESANVPEAEQSVASTAVGVGSQIRMEVDSGAAAAIVQEQIRTGDSPADSSISPMSSERVVQSVWDTSANGDIKAVASAWMPFTSRKVLSERALRDAAVNGETAEVRVLLAAGTDPDAANEGGRTALYFAAMEGHEETVDALAEGGADLDKASDGATPLMAAAFQGHSGVLLRLLELSADHTAVATGGYCEGKTALEMAKAWGHEEVAAVLREWAVSQRKAEVERMYEALSDDEKIRVGHPTPLRWL
eukprot:COSAG04_NODE_636_length_11710_cov_63.646973_6_plen_1454_part_00